MAVRLDVLSLVPIVYKQCTHCETIYGQAGIGETVRNELRGEYPAEILDDHTRLSAWILELTAQYGSAVSIHILDPHSLRGIWKSWRHRVRQYPTFIINDRETYTGWDKRALEKLIHHYLSEA